MTLRLNRAHTLNAMDDEMSALLGNLIEALDTSAVDAVVVTGDTRSFCAGMDLRSTDLDALGQGLGTGAWGRNPMSAIEDGPLPFVAAVEGHCVGAGLVLALACDIRIASTTATFAFPEVRHGFPPAGGIRRLVSTVGAGRAKLMLYPGHTVDAQTMLAWGGVDTLVDAGCALESARHLAQEICEASGDAVRAIKRLAHETANLDQRAASDLEYRSAAELVASPHARNRISAFLRSRTDEG